jgi:hypothetical protein
MIFFFVFQKGREGRISPTYVVSCEGSVKKKGGRNGKQLEITFFSSLLILS